MDKSKLTLFRNTLKSIKDKPYDEAMSLPGIFYTDPQWLEIERNELFAKHWNCVGRVEEVSRKGDFFAFDLAGEPILIVHGEDSVIRALSNVCRHRGTVIANGKGNVKGFVCPYHHWSYDTTGMLVNAPLMETHKTFDIKKCRLPVLKCELWQGFIFVSLDSNAPNLVQSLSPLEAEIKNYHLEEMELRYLADESWDINWKSLVENFMEGYHLSPLHRKTLHRVNPTKLCKHLKPGKAHFGYSVGFTARIPDDRVGHPDLSVKEMDNCVMFSIPPGLTVGVGSDYSSFLCIRPETPERVRIKLGLIFYGNKWSMKQIENAVALFQQTMAEDKEVLIKVQQGLGSRFHAPGSLAPADLEGTIRDFYQYLSHSLGSIL